MKHIVALLSLLLTISAADAGIFKQEKTLGSEARPAKLKLPLFYKESNSYPLVVLLHGLGNNAQLTDLYLGLSRNQDKLGYALLLPDATKRASDDSTAWNATPECCADDVNDVDDSGYIIGLVEEAVSKYSINPEQIFIMGHSNGAFMGYRLACDTEGLFKGVVSVAGSTFADESLCKTQTPVNVLQIHGTIDSTVPYTGEGRDYPGAVETVERFASRNQCVTYEENLLSRNLLLFTAQPGFDENGFPIIDGNLFDLSLKPETDEFIYGNCSNDTVVGLWRINDAEHAPVFIGRDVIRQALEFVGYQK